MAELKFEAAAELYRYCDARYAEETRQLRGMLTDRDRYNRQRRLVEQWADASAWMLAILNKFEQPEAETVKIELPMFQ